MAFDYDEARETAFELINEFGASADFILKGANGGYDAYGNITADTGDIVISGIITPLLSYSTAEVDGESILASDSFVFFHSDIAPEIGYTVTVNSDEFRVISIDELTSVSGVNIYRRIQLRR